MEIKSIHKKGSKLDLRNKRGLFLTNNVSKVHERTIKNRNDHDFRKGISSWQTGGIKNRSTSDNTLITTSIMEQNKYLVKETIIACTDAEKCFDNLWLDDGVFELWRTGTNVRDCIMVKRLNEKAKISIKTPVGETNAFDMSNIVRQGKSMAHKFV